ncbi:MAG: element excision factor XisH family protein [Microcoleus sp.]
MGTSRRVGTIIAVEIKSFIGKSPVKDLENAIGQYSLYLTLLSRLNPERTLYLAIVEEVYSTSFSEKIVQVVLEDGGIKLIVVDPVKEVITKWIN